MVEVDVELVEARLRAGEMACAGCGGELRPWGHARWRTLRERGRLVRLRPRRSRFTPLATTSTRPQAPAARQRPAAGLDRLYRIERFSRLAPC